MSTYSEINLQLHAVEWQCCLCMEDFWLVRQVKFDKARARERKEAKMNPLRQLPSCRFKDIAMLLCGGWSRGWVEPLSKRPGNLAIGISRVLLLCWHATKVLSSAFLLLICLLHDNNDFYNTTTSFQTPDFTPNSTGIDDKENTLQNLRYHLDLTTQMLRQST